MNAPKYILLASSLILLLSFSRNPVRDDYYPNDIDVIGPVKEVTEVTYTQWNKPEEATNNNLTWTDAFKVRYDKQGRITESGRCNSAGDVVFNDKIKYDGGGHMLVRKFYVPDIAAMPMTSKLEFSYDSLGRRAQVTLYNNKGEYYSRILYLYNNQNQCIERDEYFKDSVPGVQYSYQYNDKGQYTSELITRYTKSIRQGKQRFSYDYDEHNRVTEERSYLMNDSMAWSTDFKYDDKDNLIYCKRLSHISDGRYEAIGHADTTALDTYQYKYDKHGNWVEKTISLRGKIGFRSERTIKYY